MLACIRSFLFCGWCVVCMQWCFYTQDFWRERDLTCQHVSHVFHVNQSVHSIYYRYLLVINDDLPLFCSFLPFTYLYFPKNGKRMDLFTEYFSRCMLYHFFFFIVFFPYLNSVIISIYISIYISPRHIQILSLCMHAGKLLKKQKNISVSLFELYGRIRFFGKCQSWSCIYIVFDYKPFFLYCHEDDIQWWYTVMIYDEQSKLFTSDLIGWNCFLSMGQKKVE